MQTRSDNTKRRLPEVAATFLKIGAMSYGGPAIMGIMQAEIQEKRGWLSKERFLEGLAVANMLPGPAATQLGIFIGYHHAGWWGGVLAGLGFIFPAFLIMMALTLLYSTYGALPIMRDAFYGLGPVVLGIFVVAVCRLGKTALTGVAQVAIAVAAALLFAFTPVGIVGTLLLAGCVGVMLYHSRAQGLRAALVVALTIGAYHWASATLVADGVVASHATASSAPGLRDIAVFFFSVGAFTFGGGITILAFVQDQVVNQLQWLTPQEFLDGLALGQLTPGPILILAAYVGYKLSGMPGAVVGAAAIFLPSFILMLSILPVLDRFRRLNWIRAAMKAIGAAVIGVISVSLVQIAPHATPDVFTALLMVLTVGAMLAWRWPPLPLMLAGGLVGVAMRLPVLRRIREFV